MRDRDSSLGSHVLSQFARSLVPRFPFFAPLPVPVARFSPSPLRIRLPSSLPSPTILSCGVETAYVPHEYFCARRKKACTRTRARGLAVTCETVRSTSDGPSGPSCGPSIRSRRWPMVHPMLSTWPDPARARGAFCVKGIFDPAIKKIKDRSGIISLGLSLRSQSRYA